jgi:hypothetical protein
MGFRQYLIFSFISFKITPSTEEVNKKTGNRFLGGGIRFYNLAFKFHYVI